MIAVKRQNEEREAAERAAAQARVEEEGRKTAEAEAERADAERARRQEADAARAGALDQQHVPKQRLKELSWRPSKPIETDKMPKTRKPNGDHV